MANRVLFILLCLFLASYETVEKNKICNESKTTNSTCALLGENVTNYCGNFKEKSLSTKEKDYVVKIHNILRSNLSAGIYEKLPKAFYLKKISWSDELAQIAQVFIAEQCKKARNRRRINGSPFGRNIIIKEEANSSSYSLEEMIKTWLDGLQYLTPQIIAKYKNPIAGDYNFASITQMMWWNTSKVGCGRYVYTMFKCRSGELSQCNQSKTMVELVCNYFPAGNRPGDPVYEDDSTNQLICHYEDGGTVCETLNREHDGKREKTTKKPDYRFRERMIDLWPVAGKASSRHLHRVPHHLLVLTTIRSSCVVIKTILKFLTNPKPIKITSP